MIRFFSFLSVCCLTLLSCTSYDLENKNFKVIAHRGYWKNAIGADNSLQGLKAAASIGVDGVELDVFVTGDDSLLVLHGDKHGGYDIATTDFKTLRSVRLPNGEVIPTFREYLSKAKEYPNLLLMVELKCDKLYDKVLEQYAEMQMPNKVIYISCLYHTCQNILKKDPSQMVWFLGTQSHLPLDKIKADGMKGISCEIYNYQDNPMLAVEAEQLGLETAIWVVKAEKELIWGVNHGIDYIITDDPETALSFRSECR